MWFPIAAGTLRRKRRFRRLHRGPLSSAAVCLLTLCAGSVFAQTQENPQKLPPLPTGVTPLPQSAPPTGPQAPVPPPALPIPKPDKPLRTSPGLDQLAARLRTKPITLDDAVAVALATNRNLAFSSQALFAAEGRTEEARSALNPTVGVSPLGYDLRHYSAQPELAAGATLPIDITGLLRAAADEAHFQEIGYRLDVNRIRNQVVADVKSAFYDVLRAQALERVANENLQNSLDNLSDAQKKLEARTVTRFDVIRAQTAVAAAQQDVIRARNTTLRSRGLLNNAIGIDITTPLLVQEGSAVAMPPGVPPPAMLLTPPGAPNPAAPPNAPAAPPNPAPAPGAMPQPGQNAAANPTGNTPNSLDLGPEFRSVVQEALATRPEVLEAGANIAAAQRGIFLARRSVLPSAALSAGYVDERNFTGTTRVQEPRFLLNLTFPLYDGGLSRSLARQARAAVATAQTNQRQAVDFVTLDVQQTYLNLVQARDQVAVANQALTQAQAGFELARVRYEAGVSARAGISPLLELSDAQAALTLAESSQVNALYDYNNARAQLDRSAGRFAYVQNGPGFARPPAAVK